MQLEDVFFRDRPGFLHNSVQPLPGITDVDDLKVFPQGLAGHRDASFQDDLRFMQCESVAFKSCCLVSVTDKEVVQQAPQCLRREGPCSSDFCLLCAQAVEERPKVILKP